MSGKVHYMADISVTAANVVAAAGATIRQGTAGATITAGQPLYEDSTASFKLKPAQADVVAEAKCVGIALHGASNGQPVSFITAGGLNIGATLTVGQVYVVSDAAAGGVAPYADLATGDFVTVLGVATTASNLVVNIQVSGIAKP
jgi:hypothetical protein